MKKKLFLITLSLFLVCGCGKIPKLKNGEEAVVTFKNGDKISANELYNELKKEYALEATINLIDVKVLESEFKSEVKAAKQYADDTIKSMKESYGGDEALLQAIQTYTNYSTIDGYKNMLYINYLQNKATEEYAKTLPSEKDVKSYYENTYFGDISINHILITPSVKANATDDEKQKAEEKAKKTAEEVISKLEDAKKNNKDVKKTFESLAKEYSKDDSTKNKGGALGYINLNSLGKNYDELVNNAVKLKDGSFSTTVITTDLGYHVIYRVDQKKKPALNKVEKDIRAILSQSYLSSDASITAKALQHYRKEYGVEIIDSDIKSEYSNYMNKALNQTNNNQNK